MDNEFKIYIGFSKFENDAQFDSIVSLLIEKKKLHPILREKEQEVFEVLTRFGIKTREAFFRSNTTEVLLVPGGETLVCLNHVSIFSRRNIVEIYILYKDEGALGEIIGVLNAIEYLTEVEEGTYLESRVVERYRDDLSVLSPHGKLLLAEKNRELCRKLYDSRTREFVKDLLSTFSNLPVPLEIITTYAAGNAEAREMAEQVPEQKDLFQRRFIYVCNKCDTPMRNLSFPSKESAEAASQDSSFTCFSCNYNRCKILETFVVREGVVKVIEGGLWLESLVGDIIGGSSREIWLGVMHESNELDVVAVTLGQSILAECKDGSFGQNDLYSLMIKLNSLDADIALIITTADLHPNVIDGISKHNTRARRQTIKVIQGDSDQIKEGLKGFVKDLREEQFISFVKGERAQRSRRPFQLSSFPRR